MRIVKLYIKDACVLEFTRYHDHRGYLQELYNQDSFPPEIAQYFPVKQNTLSRSKKNVLRGIHTSPYAKLLTCVHGAVYDVVVDLRSESPTYLQWAAVKLTEDNCKQLFVPPNCGHAFYSLSDESTIVYCQGGCFDKSLKNEKTLHPLDPVINIFWPQPEDVPAVLSDKDRAAPKLDSSELRVLPNRIRVLIVGASGQVGGALNEILRQKKASYVVVGTYGQHPQEGLISFDMETAARDETECRNLLTLCRPNVICICAAFSHVDGCEKFPDKSHVINVQAVANLCKAGSEIGAKLVYYSSDYVFDGLSAAKLTECSKTNPVNQYGKHKLEAEHIVLMSDKQNLVIRTSRVYGPEVQGKNFVYAVVKSGKTNSKIPCLRNETSCPTYNRDLAVMTMKLIESDLSGVYHCAGPERFTKAEWARAICRYFNLDESLIEEVETVGETPRPKYVPLDTRKLTESLGDHAVRKSFVEAMDHWKRDIHGDKSLFC